jgi:hypothetical protein
MVHLASKMTVVRPTRPFSSAWVQQSYWVPPVNMESNVLHLFENAVIGKDGIYKGKRETLEEVPKYQEANSLGELRSAKGNIWTQTKSCIDALRQPNLPDNSVDYIFTDPPYGGSIQYGELLFLWASWLGFTKDFVSYDKMVEDEIIMNDYRSKSFDEYYRMMHAAFVEMSRVLKNGRYMTVTFHNPEFKIRNGIIRAAIFAGFDFEKTIYQPPARASAKGLLQPFGTLDGDYYLRFRNAKTGRRKTKVSAKSEEIAQTRLENVIVETAKKIIGERGDPTPFTFIQNAIDPLLYAELRKHGLLVEYDPESLEKTLRRHIGDVFVLTKMKINGKSGKAWWLKDAGLIKQIPLNKRVEETIVSFLSGRYKATFTEILTKLYTQFKNSLTPDTETVSSILKEIAVHVGENQWQLKPVALEYRRAHEEMVYYLGVLGKKLGYKVSIAIDENKKVWNARRLADLLKPTKHPTYPTIQKWNLSRIRRIDVIWCSKDRIEYEFEVEYSTTINDAILRGSNIPWKETHRCIVIPKARASFMGRRLRDPAMKDLVGDFEWRVVTFENLRDLFLRVKGIRGFGKSEFDEIIKVPIETEPETTTVLDQFMT